MRKDQGRRGKKVFEREPEGSRRKCRPRVKWLENIEKGVWGIDFRDGESRQLIGKKTGVRN